MRGILIITGIVAVLAFVGSGDYEEAKADEAFYCEMVATGVWPDFRELYKATPRREACRH